LGKNQILLNDFAVLLWPRNKTQKYPKKKRSLPETKIFHQIYIDLPSWYQMNYPLEICSFKTNSGPCSLPSLLQMLKAKHSQK
jgi:hypothetical protein